MEIMPSIEKISYLEVMVIDGLKKNDSEVSQLFREWAIADEQRVLVDENDSNRAWFGHNIKFAELYEAGGLKDEAIDAYWQVFETAINEKQDEIADRVLLKIIEFGEVDLELNTHEGRERANDLVIALGDILAQYSEEIGTTVFDRHSEFLAKVLIVNGKL